MSTNAYENYLETEILTADPLKLVVLLHRGAIDAVRCARQHLAAGDIRSRSLSITKAVDILAELAQTLDHERGGELSNELARLYDFMLMQLAEANTRQIDAPLANAERVLAILLDGWDQCAAQRPASPSLGNWMPAYQSEEVSYVPVSYAG